MSETPTVHSDAPHREQIHGGLARMAHASAARVYGDGVAVGDTVVFAAAAVGNHQRTVAIIEAGPEGIRVRPVVNLPRLAITAVAAAAVVWMVRRKPALR